MERIVVGFDGSASAEAALRWAETEAAAHGARLELVVVAEDGRRGPEWAPDGGAVAEWVERHIRQRLETLEAGQAGTLTVRAGAPAEVLVAASREADLLVCGAQGLTADERRHLGSVTRACLHQASCSIAVIRSSYPDSDQKHRVVVGVAEADQVASEVIDFAATEARLRDVTLEAVHAVHWDHLGAEFLAPTDSQLAEWGQRLLRIAITAAGVPARPVVACGSPAQVLVQRSAGAQLLVLGSRGSNPLASMVLGATSDHCARHARCPVLIHRRGTPRA